MNEFLRFFRLRVGCWRFLVWAATVALMAYHLDNRALALDVYSLVTGGTGNDQGDFSGFAKYVNKTAQTQLVGKVQ